MLFVGSIEKLCECGGHAPKNDNFCQLSSSCGSSPVFLRHIHEQSGDGSRKPYFRNISCGVRSFSWFSGFSDADVADVSASITKLLRAKCDS